MPVDHVPVDHVPVDHVPVDHVMVVLLDSLNRHHLGSDGDR